MTTPNPETPVVALSDSSEESSYVIACDKCHASFDAVMASWCACVVNERTLVCPVCSACFCKASVAYKQRVWRLAPRTLWDRKFEEHSAVPVAEPAVADDSELARPLVLLVEDEGDVRRMATAVIRELGYGLAIATNGQEGLAMAKQLKPELVLTDALMPKLDGREMCRQIKDDPDCHGMRVVVMTALYTSYKYQNEAYKAYRVDGYLAKPIAVTDLRSLLKQELG